MSERPAVAVAHYPEGAGHATRMLAIAKALESEGANVSMAGGGAGSEFVALNGYDAVEPTAVDYIDSYQGGSLRAVLTSSVPATAARVTEYIEWLRDLDPDALVTDDMFAAMAALRTDVPLYALKHDLPALYEGRIERAGARYHAGFQRAAAREFFYPAVWPRTDAEPADATRVPPVALPADVRERGDHNVVVVPSHYSDLGRVADALDREGYDVVDVGGDDWEAVPSLLPYIRAADIVVCSGYSTVMDAAVAGTPCVVAPATDEQEAVARQLSSVSGFVVADDALDVLEAVADPSEPPAYDNGATTVADAVLADLRERRPAGDEVGREEGLAGAIPAPGPVESVTAGVRSRAGSAARVVGDRTAAAAAAVDTALRAGAHRGKAGALSAGRTIADAAKSAGAAVQRTALSVVRRSVGGIRRLGGGVRRVGASCRRYLLATAALWSATGAFAKGGTVGIGRSTAGQLRAVGSFVGRLVRSIGRLARVGADAGRALGRVGAVLGGLGGRLSSTTAGTTRFRRWLAAAMPTR